MHLHYMKTAVFIHSPTDRHSGYPQASATVNVLQPTYFTYLLVYACWFLLGTLLGMEVEHFKVQTVFPSFVPVYISASNGTGGSKNPCPLQHLTWANILIVNQLGLKSYFIFLVANDAEILFIFPGFFCEKPVHTVCPLSIGLFVLFSLICRSSSYIFYLIICQLCIFWILIFCNLPFTFFKLNGPTFCSSYL